MNPGPVEEYLATELQAGSIVEVPPSYTNLVQISCFGVIPKPNQLGKWRLILDLSSPNGSSVNDGIAAELCSVLYISVDTAVDHILQLGSSTELAKVDVQLRLSTQTTNHCSACDGGQRFM